MSPVAKSFQHLSLRCKPYIKNNKQYVKVLQKNGNQREVRWYSDIEYEKMYPEETVPIKTLKEVLGFDKEYITIFKGDTYKELEWFQQSIARYHRLFGWYIISTEEVPVLPYGIEPVKLMWNDISIDVNTLKCDKDVAEVINNLRFDPSPSEYVGTIGDKITIANVVVVRNIPVETGFGTNHMHIFEDVETKNVFIWSTSTKSLDVGSVYSLTGTVKGHKLYKNIKQTVLTRCKVREV